MAGSEFTALPRDMDPEEQLVGLLDEMEAEKNGRKAAEGAASGNLREGTLEGEPIPSVNLDRLQGKRTELSTLFRQVMAGELPRGRALKPNEPDRLDERHLNIIMLRASGMDQGIIARTTGFTEPWVSIVLNHPDAQSVLATIVGYAADNVIDLNKRIQATAPEAFDKVVRVMRTTPDEGLASRNAFEILKMAGYGAVEKKSVKHEFGLSDEGAKELAQAMREAQGLGKVEFAEFVQAHEVSVGSGSVSSGSPATSAESGQTSVSVPPIGGS